jgi:hypothetical protein
MEFILSSAIRDKAVKSLIGLAEQHSGRKTGAYWSSGPPNFRTIFRSEKIVPKISFASSSALSLAGRGRPGPLSGSPALAVLEPDCGRRALVALVAALEEAESHCLL